MVTYNTTTVFMDFFQFDINVDVKIVPNVELPFPAVTICNLTPIDRIALEESTGLDSLKNALGTVSRKRKRKKRAGIYIFIYIMVLNFSLKNVNVQAFV